MHKKRVSVTYQSVDRDPRVELPGDEMTLNLVNHTTTDVKPITTHIYGSIGLLDGRIFNEPSLNSEKLTKST